MAGILRVPARGCVVPIAFEFGEHLALIRDYPLAIFDVPAGLMKILEYRGAIHAPP